ncbi:CAMK/CAMK1 protein kinase [Phakopsora pachyrhizi]|uniref:CAMK/CAMK1 protein kinase n=1 Tax=Phakopsora pachyrhizi TaxID=170000 RepID=A0AAV0BK92_PHAPC|nr:CAMK/CAMK1 protein kinase [Phakopsora pachyrhizi]CAH7687662.1 CAMK/CAMK1 protein kinase [Phakopsora pachyrhizi]
MPPQTVPCQYKTGRTLGQGTYAVVKEAVHIKTGKYYACKVINKRLMEGREHMVRNEINVLKKISASHTSIVTLHDYFETLNNLYLVTDLCQGGELFDRICAKGQYYERDARQLVKVILQGVDYLHSHGIVHRDLKPENLLFRGPEEDSDLLIADFGLSRVIDDTKFNALTTTCGTPGYMAPEIFKKAGHGKPVDIWAIGVITYFLLCGYTPFDRDNSIAEIQAICSADYKFEPLEYWKNVSELARDFIRKCLTVSTTERLTSQKALQHPWFDSAGDAELVDPQGESKNLLPQLKRQFDAKKTFKKAIATVRASNRFLQAGSTNLNSNEEVAALIRDVERGQAEAAAESENVDLVLANTD